MRTVLMPRDIAKTDLSMWFQLRGFEVKFVLESKGVDNLFWYLETMASQHPDSIMVLTSRLYNLLARQGPQHTHHWFKLLRKCQLLTCNDDSLDRYEHDGGEEKEIWLDGFISKNLHTLDRMPISLQEHHPVATQADWCVVSGGRPYRAMMNLGGIDRYQYFENHWQLLVPTRTQRAQRSALALVRDKHRPQILRSEIHQWLDGLDQHRLMRNDDTDHHDMDRELAFWPAQYRRSLELSHVMVDTVAHPPHYQHTEWELVVETWPSNWRLDDLHRNDYRFVTEKVWRPIGMRHPFIAFGYPGMYRDLRSWGFRTFQHIVDESFDEIPDHRQRMVQWQSVCQHWMEPDRAHRLYRESRDVCHHNWAHMGRFCAELTDRRLRSYDRELWPQVASRGQEVDNSV